MHVSHMYTTCCAKWSKLSTCTYFTFALHGLQSDVLNVHIIQMFIYYMICEVVYLSHVWTCLTSIQHALQN
jgi:hypothetical protein